MLNAALFASSSSSSSSSAAASSPFLFVYGSLMSPLVLSTLLDRTPAMITDATLLDHARFPVRCQTYPGIIPRVGASVRGILLPDLTADEFQRLDEFEGDEYQRTSVSVTIVSTPTSSDGALDDAQQQQQQQQEAPLLLQLRQTIIVPAFTYIWTNPETQLDLEQEDWDFDFFCQHHLQDFLKRFATE